MPKNRISFYVFDKKIFNFDKKAKKRVFAGRKCRFCYFWNLIV